MHKFDLSFYLGIAAGLLCTISFLPQVFKIYKQKSARDISLVTFITFALGVFIWLIYGITIKEIPIILANGFTLFLVALIIVMKLKYD